MEWQSLESFNEFAKAKLKRKRLWAGLLSVSLRKSFSVFAVCVNCVLIFSANVFYLLSTCKLFAIAL